MVLVGKTVTFVRTDQAFEFVWTDQPLKLEESTLATICSSTAILMGALTAFRAFQLNRRTTEESWFKILRDIHKEFWDDKDIALVRTWLCSDEIYKELEVILNERKNKTIDKKDDYEKLEALDKYCALMIRVKSLSTAEMTKEQRDIFETLNYDLWLYKAKLRTEIYEYIKDHWKNLAPLVPTSPPERSGT